MTDDADQHANGGIEPQGKPQGSIRCSLFIPYKEERPAQGKEDGGHGHDRQPLSRHCRSPCHVDHDGDDGLFKCVLKERLKYFCSVGAPLRGACIDIFGREEPVASQSSHGRNQKNGQQYR